MTIQNTIDQLKHGLLSTEEADREVLAAIKLEDEHKYPLTLDLMDLGLATSYLYLRETYQHEYRYLGKPKIKADEAVTNKTVIALQNDNIKALKLLLTTFTPEQIERIPKEALKNLCMEPSTHPKDPLIAGRFVEALCSIPSPQLFVGESRLAITRPLFSDGQITTLYNLFKPFLEMKPMRPAEEINLLAFIGKTSTKLVGDTHPGAKDEASRQALGGILVDVFQGGGISEKLLPYISSTQSLEGTAIANLANKHNHKHLNGSHGLSLLDYLLVTDSDQGWVIEKLESFAKAGHSPKAYTDYASSLCKEDKDKIHSESINLYINTDIFKRILLNNRPCNALSAYLSERCWDNVLPIHHYSSENISMNSLRNVLTSYQLSTAKENHLNAIRLMSEMLEQGTAPVALKRSLYAFLLELKEEPAIQSFHNILRHLGFIDLEAPQGKVNQLKSNIYCSSLFKQDKIATIMDQDNLLVFLADNNFHIQLQAAIKSGHDPMRPVEITGTGTYTPRGNVDYYAISSLSKANYLYNNDSVARFPDLLSFAAGGLSKIQDGFKTIPRPGNNVTLKTLKIILKWHTDDQLSLPQSFGLLSAPDTLNLIEDSGKQLCFDALGSNHPASLIKKELSGFGFGRGDSRTLYQQYVLNETLKAGIRHDDIVDIESGESLSDIVFSTENESLITQLNHHTVSNIQGTSDQTVTKRRKMRL